MDAILDLQQSAGNRAVVQLLAASHAGPPPPVQRRPSFLGPDDDEPTSRVDPGALVLKPDDTGKPADQMEWDELEDAIDENESIVRSATQSTPDVRRRRARLVELYAAQQKLGSKAAAGAQGKAAAPRSPKARGRKQPPPVMPPKPETLTRGSLDWANTPGAVARRELSLVVAYLAANPPKAEREILLLELPNIERAAGAARAEKQQARHIEQVTEALSPKGGSDQDKFDEILRRLQNAERDTAQEDVWLVHYEGRVLPLSSAELAAVRERVGKGLMEAARKISRFVYDVEGAWEERTQHNRSHSRTHKLVKFATGADDIPRSDIDKMLSNSRFYTSRIRERATSGQLVEAGNDLAVFDRNARYYAEKVGNWESELMRGAGRWVLGLTILKEALSIMAGFGAARLAALAGGGSTIATFKAGAKIATMTTGTGLLAGGAGAEAAGGDWKQGARAGGGAGFGVGSGALTAGIGKIASVGDAAKATTFGGKAIAVGKAAGLETVGGVATSSTQALIEGGDVGDAALGALVSSPISTLGGGAVDKLAKGKVAATAGQTGVGMLAGTAGAAATDQNLLAGALQGGGGAFYGSTATHLYGDVSGAGGGRASSDGDVPAAPGAPMRPATLDTALPVGRPDAQLPSAGSGVGAAATGEPIPATGGSNGAAARDAPSAGSRPSSKPSGPDPQPNAGGVQDFDTLIKSWSKPDPGKLRPASIRDADGAAQERPNVKIHEDIARPDIEALLVEMEKTPWGSRIAEGLRNGDIQLTLLPPWELPFGGLHYPGGETYIAWSGSIHEIAAQLHHEGSHWLDPHLVSREGSRLGMEAEARVFEYEYRDLVGLPAYDQIHAATRQAYNDVIAATRTRDMPDGDVKAARVAADRTLLEALRRDHKRVAVESRKQERRRIADRRDVRKLNVDEILESDTDPRIALPDAPLEVETVFGDEPTSPGTGPGKAATKAAPEDTGPNALPDDPVIPPPKANSEQLRLEELLKSAVDAEQRAAADEKRALERKDKGAAAAARERFDAAGAEIHRIVERLAQLPKPGPSGGSAPAQPTPAPNPLGPDQPGRQGSGDAGLVGDKKRPGRKAKILPEKAYEAADRPLTSDEESRIRTRQKEMRDAIAAKLSGMTSGKESGYDAQEFRRITGLLAQHARLGSNARILKYAETVWDAVHDPALVADVLSRLYGESLRRPGAASGLDPLTKAILREAALTGPLYVAPPRVMIEDDAFFLHWVSTGRRWLDLGTPENHGQTPHLIQDLVVDEKFRQAGVKMTAQQFRRLLAEATLPGTTDIQGGPGNRLWIALFDAAVGINTPEKLMPALRLIPGLEGLR